MRFPPPSLFSIPRRGGLCTALLLSGCGPQVSEDSAVDTDRSTNSPDFIRVDENAATLEEWDYTIEEWQAHYATFSAQEWGQWAHDHWQGR